MAKLKKQSKKTERQSGALMTYPEMVLQIYLAILCIGMPLYMPDRYADLGNYKYFFFRNTTTALIAAVIIYGVVWIVRSKLHKSADMLKFSGGGYKSRLNVMDWFAVVFLGATILSLLVCPYKSYAVFGIDGWMMGAISQGMFVFLYFVFSRCFRKRTLAVWSLGIGAGITFIIGYLNRFGVDPLSVYEGMPVADRIRFLGTIGQATWYSSFLAVSLPVFIGIYVWWEKLEAETTRTAKDNPTFTECLMIISRYPSVKKLVGVMVFIGCASAVNQNSDSIYLALGVVIFLMVLFMREMDEREILNCLEVWIIGLSAFKMTGVLQKVFYYEVTDLLDRLSIFMSQSWVIWGLLAVLLVLWICMKRKPQELGRVIPRLFMALFILSVAAGLVVYCVLHFGFGLFPFDESWGNSRGYIWSFMFQLFRDNPLIQKIIGVGPNCTALTVEQFYAADIHKYWGEMTLTNAHNEWMTMIIDEGFVGGLAYLGWFCAALYTAWKNRREHVYCRILMFSVGAYMIHNFFCYQQVMCTPYIMIAMGLISGMAHKEKIANIR